MLNSKRLKLLNFATLFMLVGIIIGLTISTETGVQRHSFGKDRPDISSNAIQTLAGVSDAMVEVVAAVKPSVVNISTTRTVMGRDVNGGMFNDPFFRRFFGDEMLRGFGEQRSEEQSSLGSGVIVDAKGYILTNNHVIKDADKITVTLMDEREFEGKLIGTDPKTDIAVIKIDADDLQAIRWGDSEKLRVGEMIFAVGSPYGLNQTVTSGIVSAKGRANVRIADFEDFIQTDAAINPGNSGGPLINIRAELVGINTAIFSTTGGYQGIGFSIPSNMVRSIMDSLIAHGKVVRGWLGVSIQSVNKELAEYFKLKETRGALISDVIEGSPAEKAGLKRGDVVIRFAGKDVEDSLMLRNFVASTAPGTKVNITFIRDDKEKTLSVEIEELTGEVASLTGGIDNALKGLTVQDLTPELRNTLGIPRRYAGVVVTQSDQEDGPRRGDLIMEINRITITDMKDYRRVASQIREGQPVVIVIYRDGGVFYLTLTER